MEECVNNDAKSAKLCMISTLSIQFPGIIMEYNRLTDRSIVGILNIFPKIGEHQTIIAADVTWHLRVC